MLREIAYEIILEMLENKDFMKNINNVIRKEK